jgi:hypothetical protein
MILNHDLKSQHAVKLNLSLLNIVFYKKFIFYKRDILFNIEFFNHNFFIYHVLKHEKHKFYYFT